MGHTIIFLLKRRINYYTWALLLKKLVVLTGTQNRGEGSATSDSCFVTCLRQVAMLFAALADPHR